MRIILFLIALFQLSCSGYRFRNNSNPLKEYGISSVSVPMFLNRTPIANVAGPYTKEFISILSEFKDLKVVSGDRGKTDAVLLGTISGDRKNSSTFVPGDRVFTSSAGLRDSIGDRLDFYITSETSMGLSVNLILIKNPTHREIELLRSEAGMFIKNHPKIIFQETLGSSGTFKRVLNQNTSPDEGGVTNFTQSKGLRDKKLVEMAESTAQSFKNLILYVF